MELRNEESLIIILSGKARSGKDTSMEMMKKIYESEGKKVITLFYASYIKNYAQNISDWDGREETKPRTLLQVLGTDIIRNTIDTNFFINRIKQDIIVYSKFFDVIIIGDARFPDEIEEIESSFNKVKTIRVERPNNNSEELTSKEKLHATETGLDSYTNYDFRLVNDGTLEDLENKVKDLIKEME